MENQTGEDLYHENRPKQRHGCLTAWLILMIVLNALVGLTYLLASSLITNAMPGISSMLVILLGFICLANVLFAIFLFQWKKWAFWGFVVSSVVILVINLSTGLDIIQSLAGLIGIAVIYGVLQIKADDVSGWDNLE